jgi:hypothetical protein
MVNMATRNTTADHPPPEGRTAAAPLTAGQITSSHHTPQSIARRRRPPSSSSSSCSGFRPEKVTHFFLSAWEEVCWYENTGGFGLICGSVSSNKNHHFAHAPPVRTLPPGKGRIILHLVTGNSSCGMVRVSRSQTERTNERGGGEHSTYSVIVRSVVTAGCPTKEVNQPSGGARRE